MSRRGSVARGAVSAILAATGAMVLAGCGSDASDPSVEEGGLPVYSVGAPEDVDTLEVAEALADVLDLPPEAEVETRGSREARIEGGGHSAVVQDRGAGSVIVNYSGPRFENRRCVDCPDLDDTDDAAGAIELSTEILEAIGVDTANVEFSEGSRTDVDYRIVGDVVIDGAVIDDLGFRFVWTHGDELKQFSGGLFEVEEVGTVAPRDEAEARAQAETMIGSEREIVEFGLVYTGGFRDGELIVAPAYLATTDLGTTFTVSAFTGELPQ